MSDLAAFLLARYAEDEGCAREAAGLRPEQSFEGGDAVWCSSWLGAGIRHLVRNCDVECQIHEDDDTAECGRPHRYAGEHVARWDPARVIAECEAKRRIVEHYWVPTLDDLDTPARDYPTSEHTLRLLALPYADHPEFDPAWRS